MIRPIEYTNRIFTLPEWRVQGTELLADLLAEGWRVVSTAASGNMYVLLAREPVQESENDGR